MTTMAANVLQDELADDIPSGEGEPTIATSTPRARAKMVTRSRILATASDSPGGQPRVGWPHGPPHAVSGSSRSASR